MESEHFLFSRTMSRELHEKWQKALNKKPLNRRYLPLEDPVQIIRGELHQRYWNNDSMGLSMSLAAINWWNFHGKQKIFTKAGLDKIITSGRFDHNEARSNKSETEISQDPALYVSIREYPWSILSNTSEYYTLHNWQIPVQIGRGHCMGDMENLTDFLRSFAEQPFATTVTIGGLTNAIFYNKKKQWIIFDSYGNLKYLDHTAAGVSAWVFNRPEAIEAFISNIRSHDGQCFVSKPVFVSKRIMAEYPVKLDLSLRFGTASESGSVQESSSNPGTVEPEYGDDDSYVSFMGGFGEDLMSSPALQSVGRASTVLHSTLRRACITKTHIGPT